MIYIKFVENLFLKRFSPGQIRLLRAKIATVEIYFPETIFREEARRFTGKATAASGIPGSQETGSATIISAILFKKHYSFG